MWVSEDELISIFKGGFRSRIVNRKWDSLQISQFTMFHIIPGISGNFHEVVEKNRLCANVPPSV